jgi:hypothetical protein
VIVAQRSVPESQGRETRILLLIVVVSIALLLVLARLRYPAADLPVIAPTQAPLTLNIPQGFDDLSRRLSALHATVSTRLLLLHTDTAPAPAARRGGVPPRPAPAVAQPALAVRIRPDLAVMYVPRGQQPRVPAGMGAELVFRDETREMAVLRVPPNLEAIEDQVPGGFSGMTYVGVLMAARTSITLQPAFVGPVGTISDPRWPAGVLDWGPIAVGRAGAAVFTLDGRLLGVLAAANGSTVLVPTTALDELAARAQAGAPAQ